MRRVRRRFVCLGILLEDLLVSSWMVICYSHTGDALPRKTSPLNSALYTFLFSLAFESGCMCLCSAKVIQHALELILLLPSALTLFS